MVGERTGRGIRWRAGGKEGEKKKGRERRRERGREGEGEGKGGRGGVVKFYSCHRSDCTSLSVTHRGGPARGGRGV